MASEKPPVQPQAGPQPTAPQPKPPVVERAPLTVTVLDTTDTPVHVETQIRVPQRVERRQVSPYVPLLLGLAAVLLFGVYRMQYAPLVLRFEHGLQRRIYGEREYDAHRGPHAPQQVDRLGKWSAEYHLRGGG